MRMGAFAGLEKIVSARTRGTSVGFGTDVRPVTNRATGALLKEVEPEDLLKFGLIPEFIGRLPVIATLDDLDEKTLVQILTEPKNALTKQYALHFEMENVPFVFTDDSLRAIAKKGIARKLLLLLLLLLNEKIMVACCQRLRGHRTVSKVRASVLRTRNSQTRPKLSYRKASGEQFSLQVPLERCQRW